MMYHNPVLLFESVDGLAIVPNGVYIDVTFGGGGHSREILKRLGPEGKLFAFDQDEDAQNNRIDDERFTLVSENFRHIKRFLKFYGITKVNGILADLGVSSHQFDVAERGFSTRFDADLDMRMSKKQQVSAYQVLNEYDASALSDIFYRYGELSNAKAFAARVVECRSKQPLKTSFELIAYLEGLVPKKVANKVLAQVFQALRIEVNQELDVLQEFLLQAPELLVKGGRLSVISYHSLEDRLVKRFMKNGKFEGEPEKDFYGNINVPFKTQKLIVPSAKEVGNNNRARSARLRIATKL